MSPAQVLTQKDLYTELQKVIASGVAWDQLTTDQKNLFANPLLLVSLNVKSNQEAFNLIRSQPDLLFVFQENLNATVDAALLEYLVNEMNQQEALNNNLETNLSAYSKDQQELIKKLIEIRARQIQAEQIQKTPETQHIETPVNNLDTKQDPRLKLIRSAKTAISSAASTSPVRFTPKQELQATKLFLATSLTANLDLNQPQDLSLAVISSLVGANPKYANTNPVASICHQINQGVLPATNQDYQQAIQEAVPQKILDPQANIVIDISKIPPPKQISLQTIKQSSQKIIRQITPPNNDPTDISDILIAETKKLQAIKNNPQAINISRSLVTQISNQQLDQLVHAINQINPNLLQLPTRPGQEAASAVNQVTPKNPGLSPQAIRLYSQGLDSQTLIKVYQNARIRKIISPRQFYNLHQQIKTIDSSQLGKDIKPQPLGFTARRFQTLTNKISGKLPQGLGKPLNHILHPVQSVKGWLGKQIGRRLGVKIYKAFAKRIKNKTVRTIAKTLLRQGLKQGVKTLISMGFKGVAIAAKSLVGATGVGVVLVAAWKTLKFVGKKIWRGVQDIARSIWGEKLKPRELLALPLMAAAGIGSALTSLGTVTVAAASSAGATIAISAAAGALLYLTAFTVAPLISTIAQLEMEPALQYSFISPGSPGVGNPGDPNYIPPAPTGPIPPGCPSGWPTPSGYVTQGPKTDRTHYGVEAIDIGAGLGTPILATHPGRAIAVGSSGPYGNYVDLYGVCQGVNFITRYAHMPSVPFSGEKLVAAGEQIGVVNNTGNSTGNHLHYEIRGSALGDINQFLPKPVIRGCVEFSQCQVTIP